MSISATGTRSPSSSTGKPPSYNVGKSKAGYRPAQLQQFNPDQMKLFERMFGQVGPDSYLSRLAGGDEEIFNQIEAPALRQFSGLQGNIASRFSGMGSGAQRSSGFKNTLNQASSDFASDLQAQRMGLQRNAIQDLHQMSNDLLNQRPYENFLLKKEPGFLKQIGLGIANQGGRIAGNVGQYAAMGGYGDGGGGYSGSGGSRYSGYFRGGA